jgi:hypothetical protein
MEALDGLPNVHPYAQDILDGTSAVFSRGASPTPPCAYLAAVHDDANELPDRVKTGARLRLSGITGWQARIPWKLRGYGCRHGKTGMGRLSVRISCPSSVMQKRNRVHGPRSEDGALLGTTLLLQPDAWVNARTVGRLLPKGDCRDETGVACMPHARPNHTHYPTFLHFGRYLSFFPETSRSSRVQAPPPLGRQCHPSDSRHHTRNDRSRWAPHTRNQVRGRGLAPNSHHATFVLAGESASQRNPFHHWKRAD